MDGHRYTFCHSLFSVAAAFTPRKSAFILLVWNAGLDARELTASEAAEILASFSLVPMPKCVSSTPLTLMTTAVH